MPQGHRQLFLVATSAALMLGAAHAYAQTDPQPINDLPNPYRTLAPWGQPPQAGGWGALNGVAIDPDGQALWVATRCGANPDTPPGESPFAFDSCANSNVSPVLKLDASGKVVKSFGADMFIFPHKTYVDADGNVWVVDARGANEREVQKSPGAKGKGHVVVKFSPEGKVLLTLGTPGVAGNPPHALTEPCSVVTAPNGDIYVAEGHSGQLDTAGPNTVGRI